MSTVAELLTLVRQAPEMTTALISDADALVLVQRAQIEMARRGRALPKNEKVDLVKDQREYVVAGTSPVLTDNDFLSIDLQEGGVLFYDGSRWVGSSKEGHGSGEFEPKTREWLDKNDVGWRSRSSTSSAPQYWYLGTKEDGSSDLVVGLSDAPDAAYTDRLWIHYLARGKLPTSTSNHLWTDSPTVQLVHLEEYELIVVWWILDFLNRVKLHNPQEANLYRQLFETGIAAMASRFPLSDHLQREGMAAVSPFTSRLISVTGGRRY